MGHPKAAEKFMREPAKVTWHDETLWQIRQKRDKISRTIPEWEWLRETASHIKAHTMSDLDGYLKQFEENAGKNGIKVHWAKDADEHNKIVGEILERKNVGKLVKSKSMLTEECHLNPHLQKMGIEVIDTDLGERIMQLGKEPPSHIVLPAIHKKKEEIGKIFHETMGTEEGLTDPQQLTEIARQNLRDHFLSADASLTGVNFAIAESGGIVVCTNEGNADLGVHSTPLHIACMGLEKIIPKIEHLGVFLRLLARSATGQPITVYSSHIHGPRPGAEMHLVIVDNGRSKHLGREDFREGLHCIRCGACMNTCPVYRRSGGHSYNYTVPGPIGSILTPRVDLKKYSSMPFASSLCGSCSFVCPVKIDIHHQLYKWRQVIVREGQLPFSKKISMKVTGKILENPKLYKMAGGFSRALLRITPKFLMKLNPWGRRRDLPTPPRESFRSWYLKNRN